MRWNLKIHCSSNDDILTNLCDRIDQPVMNLLVLVLQVDELIDIDFSIDLGGIHCRYHVTGKGMKLNIASDEIYNIQVIVL